MSGENKYNCDYAVPKKSEGSYKTKRILMRLAYWLIPLTILAVLFVFIKYFAFVFVPVFLTLARPLINGTWRYVNYDQRYEIKNAGTIRFTHYYGKKFRVDKNDEHAEEQIAEKLILEMKIKDFELIAPYTEEEHRRAFDELGIKPENIINHTSSPVHPNVYYGVYTKENGEKAAILFDMIDKSLGIIVYYNKKTVVTELHFAGENALK